MKTRTAIKHFNGASKLARALGLSRAAISLWGKEVPKGRAFEIEVLTGGKLKARQPKKKKVSHKNSCRIAA